MRYEKYKKCSIRRRDPIIKCLRNKKEEKKVLTCTNMCGKSNKKKCKMEGKNIVFTLVHSSDVLTFAPPNLRCLL